MLQNVVKADECHAAPAGPKLASGAFSGVEGSANTPCVYNKEMSS